MRSVSLTLPYPPSANVLWRSWRGRTVVSAEARKFKRDVALIARKQGVKRLEGPLALCLIVYRPRKSGDLSNRIKILEDSLNGIAWTDDSQIVRIVADRKDDKANPRVEVFVQQEEEEQ